MRAAILLGLLLLIPSGQALFNDPLPYEDSQGFTTSFEGIPAFISGAVEYNGVGAQNASLLFGTSGFTVTGLTRICWEDSSGSSRCDSSSGLQVTVSDGASVAFRTPDSYSIDFAAEHALAFFADAGAMFGGDPDGGDREERLELGQSMVAIPTEDTIHIHDVAHLPSPALSTYSSFNDALNDLALLLTMSPTSTITLENDAGEIDTLSGNGRWVGFQGDPKFTPTSAAMAILPLPNGATAMFTQATDEAAQAGLGADNLNQALASMEQAEGAGEGEGLAGIGDVADALTGFLNGALIHVDLSGAGESASALELLDQVTLVRFESMDASRADNEVDYDGAAALQIQNGEVAGAKPLFFGMPILGIVLWGIAVVMFAVRIALRPSQKHVVWDKLGWVGWIGGLVAGVLVFFLWDIQMAKLWGASILTSGASGATLGAIAVLQIVPLLIAAIFFGMPTRSITKSATRFLGQGRMMNIGGVIAPFVTFVLGVPLMLSLLALVLSVASG